MPTNISFWNVQRLGKQTNQARQNALINVLGLWNTDRTLVCELTTGSTWPPFQNLTYRKKNARQLCYGAWNANGYAIDLDSVTPESTPEYQAAALKGGNDFTNLADRALGSVGVVNGTHVYVIHAPASNKAKKVMSFIACFLDELHAGDHWVVLGDFNVEPDELAKVQVGINIVDYIFKSGQPTHLSPGGATSELDYALSNSAVTVTAQPQNVWAGYSDHSPILVSW